MKIDIDDLLRGTSFFAVGPKTALLKGPIKARDIMKLRNWVQAIRNESGQGYTLIIDSEGGISDPGLLLDMFQVPIHTHVANEAASFAGLIALMGTYRTGTPPSFFMFHRPEWRDQKAAEEIAEDNDVLFRHRYTVLSMLAKIIPAGEAKEILCEALLLADATYVKSDWLYDEGALDDIVDYTAADLGLYKSCEDWYDNTYPAWEGPVDDE